MSELSVRETAARAAFDVDYPDVPTAERDAAWAEMTEGGRDTAWHHSTDAVLAAVAADDGLADVPVGHVLDEYANTCSCKRWEHFEDPYDVRIASFAAHLADVVRAWLRGES